MEKGTSIETRLIARSLTEEDHLIILELLKNIELSPLRKPDFSDCLRKIYQQCNETDLMNLRTYTGYNFKSINAVLRDNWTYEENGLLTPEKEADFQNRATEISRIIRESPRVEEPFVTYRGTTLKEFKKYGITSLEELTCLKDKFLYESGFTSTAINERTSYFSKEIEGVDHNIEIIYLIPGNSQDGIPLTTKDLSYSPAQQEYLLDCGSLSKVLNVEVTNNQAILTVLLVPKYIWDKKPKEATPEITK